MGANHWDKAIATHVLNFHGAEHLIADVSNYDMRRLSGTDVLWASPICTELSPAGGQARRRQHAQLSLLEPAGHVPSAALDRTRATFWDVVRATEVHRYKVVLIENVVDRAGLEPPRVGEQLLGFGAQLLPLAGERLRACVLACFAPQS